ncbi:MAG TPA: hypothetical protein VFC23_13275 [Thermoanaerobaculia bacterium]|nr:hypothetical protein [Thermoanaerobaculia bacterium]
MLFVRHLLRQCPSCGNVLREISQRRYFRLVLLRSAEDSSRELGDRLKGRAVARPRAAASPWRTIRRA